jgi:uncharacterized protein YegP (UPF0339 family)
MKRAIFEIKQNAVGRYYFILKDTTEKGLVVSRSFSDRSRLETCIAQVRDKAPLAEIKEDLEENMRPPVFFIEKDKTGYTFSLIGFENEVIFSSESYSKKDECIKAIELLKNLALDAGIVDSV